MVGIAVGLITFLVLVATAGIAYCCVHKRRAAASAAAASSASGNHPPSTPSQNLIDMHSPSYPSSTSAVLSPPPSYNDKFAPASPQWDAAAPAYGSTTKQQQYFAPHQQSPVGVDGQVLIELQSPVVRQQPPMGGHVHELA
jgi:hypothetical protein